MVGCICVRSVQRGSLSRYSHRLNPHCPKHETRARRATRRAHASGSARNARDRLDLNEGVGGAERGDTNGGPCGQRAL